MSKHDTFELRHDICHLRVVALHELPTCGDVEENVLYRKVRPHIAEYRLLVKHSRPFDAYFCSGFLPILSSAENHLCHCGDAGQSFATESHCGKREKICSLPYL